MANAIVLYYIYLSGGHYKVRSYEHVQFNVQQEKSVISLRQCAIIFGCDFRYAIQGYGNTNFNE